MKYRDNNASPELRAWLYWTNIDRSTVRRTMRRSHLANARRVNVTKKNDLWVGGENQMLVTPCCRRGGSLHGVGFTFGRRPEISYPARDCVRWGERRAIRGRNRTGARLLTDSQDHPSRHQAGQHIAGRRGWVDDLSSVRRWSLKSSSSFASAVVD